MGLRWLVNERCEPLHRTGFGVEGPSITGRFQVIAEPAQAERSCSPRMTAAHVLGAANCV